MSVGQAARRLECHRQGRILVMRGPWGNPLAMPHPQAGFTYRLYRLKPRASRSISHCYEGGFTYRLYKMPHLPLLRGGSCCTFSSSTLNSFQAGQTTANNTSWNDERPLICGSGEL